MNSWVRVVMAPSPSPQTQSSRPLSPKRVEQLKTEAKKDKLPTPDFLSTAKLVKKVKKEPLYFEDIEKEFSLTDGGWGDSSDDEM